MHAVSLLPAVMEIAAALGLVDQVVGVSHERDFPKQALSEHLSRIVRF
jgi:ABC-type hemin transport system substrate-binding protein